MEPVRGLCSTVTVDGKVNKKLAQNRAKIDYYIGRLLPARAGALLQTAGNLTLTFTGNSSVLAEVINNFLFTSTFGYQIFMYNSSWTDDARYISIK